MPIRPHFRGATWPMFALARTLVLLHKCLEHFLLSWMEQFHHHMNLLLCILLAS